MTVTININNITLVHKGSNGISTATLPDVCKTPSPGGPVPVPYPNISMASNLAEGTTTVKADGGNMIAVKGSEFSLSTGDEPGTAGGGKSSTFKKESKWILYSFDVKMEGKNACRLSDKKTQNHENTVDLAGVIQPPLTLLEADLKEVARQCHEEVEEEDKKKTPGESCTVKGTRKHACCKKKLQNEPYKSSHPDMQSEYTPPGAPDCRLDVAVVKNGNVTKIYDFKFNCKNKPKMSRKQERKYRKKFPLANVLLVGA